MSVYTVQAPTDSLGEPDLERAVLLREGFSWPAFFFGLLWLLWQRLWGTALLWLVAFSLLAWLALWHFGFGRIFLIGLALRILLGLEANALVRRKLARRRYRLIEVVTAAAPETAERLFFSRVAPSQAERGPAEGCAASASAEPECGSVGRLSSAGASKVSTVIVDYGSGNLHSAHKAFERAAREAGLSMPISVSGDPEAVRQAERIVLPGVGAFADCRRGLGAVPGMIEALAEAVLTRAGRFSAFVSACSSWRRGASNMK